MAIRELSEKDIEEFLEENVDWKLEKGKLHREYEFADFQAAFAFMTGAALVAERMNHHPEWCNVYSRVVVDLFTHEAAGITSRDLDLAEEMERIAAQAG